MILVMASHASRVWRSAVVGSLLCMLLVSESAVAGDPKPSEPLGNGFYRCGSLICTDVQHADHSIGGLVEAVASLGGPVMRSAEEPLQGVNTKSFKVLEDSYATDGRNVWCRGQTKPVSASKDFRPLGKGYYVTGTVVRTALCEALGFDDSHSLQTMVAKDVTLPGCGLIRYRNVIFGDCQRNSTHLYLCRPLAIADPATFRIVAEGAYQCEAVDSKGHYAVADGAIRVVTPPESIAPPR